MLLSGLRWENVDLEDLERIFATERAELVSGLRRGIWMIGTVGSLAPFVGLFGTVIGIIRAFNDMASNTGRVASPIVANGIAEALVATAAGPRCSRSSPLSLFNYLQVRVQAPVVRCSRVPASGCVQALLYIESNAAEPGARRRATAAAA